MKLRKSLRRFLSKASRHFLGKRPDGAILTLRARPAKKILFLGGSNTVMRGGYAETLIAALADRWGSFETVTNLAVGANTTLHGLMMAKGIPDLADYDLIFIEYGVNDIEMARPGSMPIWSAGAEGLLRFLLANRPDRPVIYIQFARRDMRADQYKPASEMRKLVAHYARTHRVSLVRIDRLLRRVLFPDSAAFKALFQDNAHYQSPLATTLIGAQIAAEVLATPSRPRVARRLPGPLHAGHFEQARLVYLAPDPLTADKIFSNSRFTVPTRRIPAGESIELDLPGTLICLEYISINRSGTLRVTESGEEPFTIHTRHMKTKRTLAFQIRSTPLTWKSWPCAANSPRRIHLAGAPLPASGPTNAATGTTGSVYPSRLLYLP